MLTLLHFLGEVGRHAAATAQLNHENTSATRWTQLLRPLVLARMVVGATGRQMAASFWSGRAPLRQISSCLLRAVIPSGRHRNWLIKLP